MFLIVGDMNRIKSLKTFFVCICIVWLIFVIVPFIVWLLIPKFSIIKLWDVSFSAASALFTGIAFAVAFYSLYKQKESLLEQQENLKKQQKSLDEQQKALIKQINLRVFTDSMGLLMNNPKFRKPYEEEREAFMKNFSELEQSYIAYFIDRIDHYRGFNGGAIEMLANANAMTSTGLPYSNDNIAFHYLQKYFPRTIAAAQEILYNV